jgi:predicted enzyme involved in methoxymalonyl-ACP biosynthesis
VRLQDRFGDNGMISVVMCRREGDGWLIDTWLMSCRVLNRRLEEQILNVLCACARERGIRRLVGIYRPTAKNAMVKDHYGKLGFTLTGESDDAMTWTLDLADHVPRQVPIAITAGAGLDTAVRTITAAARPAAAALTAD